MKVRFDRYSSLEVTLNLDVRLEHLEEADDVQQRSQRTLNNTAGLVFDHILPKSSFENCNFNHWLPSEDSEWRGYANGEDDPNPRGDTLVLPHREMPRRQVLW